MTSYGFFTVSGVSMYVIPPALRDSHTQGFTTIDTDLMSLMHLSVRAIFNIGAGEETYADVEAMLDETKVYTRYRIRKRGRCTRLSIYIVLYGNDHIFAVVNTMIVIETSGTISLSLCCGCS